MYVNNDLTNAVELYRQKNNDFLTEEDNRTLQQISTIFSKRDKVVDEATRTMQGFTVRSAGNVQSAELKKLARQVELNFTFHELWISDTIEIIKANLKRLNEIQIKLFDAADMFSREFNIDPNEFTTANLSDADINLLSNSYYHFDFGLLALLELKSAEKEHPYANDLTSATGRFNQAILLKEEVGKKLAVKVKV